jgi:hypothetical protein
MVEQEENRIILKVYFSWFIDNSSLRQSVKKLSTDVEIKINNSVQSVSRKISGL